MGKPEYIIDLEQEKKDILNRYKRLLSVWKPSNKSANKTRLVRKAFNLAVKAHKDMRRRSGEPYIIHPIEVATICVEEIGLGETSIICALLHDVVEDTDYTLDDIRMMFSDKVARIIDGLTKIDEIIDANSMSLQAENFRKILFTLDEDVRVILVKMADRLHNMRTLEHMPKHKQLKISSETLYFYAPLAHRLGLYAIKSEFEDLSLKYTEPVIYNSIHNSLMETQENRDALIARFTEPLAKSLEEQGFKFTIEGRLKSVYSIWKKMQVKQVQIDEIFDLFAIRIIVDTSIEDEKVDCWRVYSTVTDFYAPNQERLRDWISTPKANGYESLHTTVMSADGKWVEVQVRSVRMNEIAERGYAAHWKYKDIVGIESGLDKWLNRVRKLIKVGGDNAIEFVEDFKLNLFSDEIFIFTPKGDLRTLPATSTVLDFAYTIHSDLGNKCIGAKINHGLVKNSHILKSGDQVEIITSKAVKPNNDWLDIVVTARAKSKIRDAINKEKKSFAEEGKTKLEQFFSQLHIEFNGTNIDKTQKTLKYETPNDLFYQIAKGTLTFEHIKQIWADNSRGSWLKRITHTFSKSKKEADSTLKDKITKRMKENPESLLIDTNLDDVEYDIPSCCNPIPGDDVMGYLNHENKISIHQTNCPKAIGLMSTYGNQIVKLKWKEKGSLSYLTGIKFAGIDEKGLASRISHVISQEHNINMKSLHIEASEGLVEGEIMLYVSGKDDLQHLIKNLKRIENLKSIFRLNRS
jgi:GTP pyrophosphokinase